MNNLCTDIGFNSLNKYSEELCGDHVSTIIADDGSEVIVLADGLGSGVKASILSTLTSTMLSTMLAQGLDLADCVSALAATLPVDTQRGVAYSTFTVLRIVQNRYADIYQYDNPMVFLLRAGKLYEFPTNALNMNGKQVFQSRVELEEDDLFFAMSDGVVHAGVGISFNFGWERKDVIEYMLPFAHVGFTAKTLTTILLDECYALYGGQPGDDATVCTLRIRRREPMNLMIGPPANRDDCDRMMSLFFSKEGKHIVCGGTTSSIAAKYLNKPLVPSLNFDDPEIPPTAEIEGVDLVTEGVITMNRVLKYATDALNDNESYAEWGYKKDGASRIARLLFEEATDINFFVGRAVNPAHQNPDLPINFNIKMRLVDELAASLRNMGKRVNVSYF